MSKLYTGCQLNLHRTSKSLAVELSSRGEKNNQLHYYLNVNKLPAAKSIPRIPCDSLFTPAGGDAPSLPTVAECASHLVLLHAINHLRREILNSQALDEILNIQLRKRTVTRTPRGQAPKEIEVRDPTWAARRGLKWPFYLNIAAARFLVWLTKVDESLVGQNDSGHSLELPCLPPLDILLVWHSALLNTDWFHPYCKRQKLTRICRAAFPWARIVAAVNTDDWEFTLPQEDSRQFQDLTGHVANLLQYLLSPKPPLLTDTLKLFGEESSSGKYKKAVSHLLEDNEMQPPHDAFVQSCQIYTARYSPGAYCSFSEYLAAAVTRQLEFVDKMVDLLWIRSPEVQGTLARAIDRYDHFLQLFTLSPGTTLVPTLDIDLAWHTHLCSAQGYVNVMIERTGRFINHDDTISKEILNPQADQTATLFQQYFGMDYGICLCWECEAIRSAVENIEDITAVDFDKLTAQTMKNVLLHRVAEANRRTAKGRGK